jgi:GDP-L-fucose synthase
MINLKHKKILVTGGSGFLGQHLIHNLINKRGVSSKNIFSPSSKQLNYVKWEDCIQAVAKMDVVIHLAAQVGGIGLNKEKPGELFYNNLIMGAQLMEAARIGGVKKFVALGTICAYPKFTPTPFKEKDLWMGYPEETNAPYGLAKKMLLVQAQSYRQQYDFNTIYLLPVNLYGEGDNFDLNSSHVIPALIRKVAEAKKQNKKTIEVWGTGRATREFLYVKDAAEGILLATERYDKAEPVNLGSGKDISINDLILLICKLMKYDGKILWNTAKPDGQPKRKLDTSKAQKEFGFRSKTSFKTGLQATIDWYLKESQEI